MKKRMFFLGIIGLISCSTQFTDDDYFDFVKGSYLLTETGVGFLQREIKDHITEPLIIGQELEVRADGSIQLQLTPPPNLQLQQVAQFQQTKNKEQAVYKLLGIDHYVSMSKSGNLLIITTNVESKVDDVLFEHLVPIARVK